MGPQRTPKPDFQVNLVSLRRPDWAIPRFSSACARAGKLLDSDAGRSIQISCWVWNRERPNLALRVAILVQSLWSMFHSTGTGEDF
jgi:hypothetical protein